MWRQIRICYFIRCAIIGRTWLEDDLGALYPPVHATKGTNKQYETKRKGRRNQGQCEGVFIFGLPVRHEPAIQSWCKHSVVGEVRAEEWHERVVEMIIAIKSCAMRISRRGDPTNNGNPPSHSTIELLNPWFYLSTPTDTDRKSDALWEAAALILLNLWKDLYMGFRFLNRRNRNQHTRSGIPCQICWGQCPGTGQFFLFIEITPRGRCMRMGRR